jgi:hypothetical protein
LLRVIVQGAPDFGDALRQGILSNGDTRPHGFQELGFGYQFTVVVHETGQNLE